WLQPERTPSRFRVPEGLSVGARTRQIHRVKLHPGRVAMTRCHPRVAVCLYFRRMAPGNIGKGAGTVCCNCGVLVEPANQLRAPAQKPNRVIPLKLAPVERITVASAARWMNVFPARVAVAVPRATQRLHRAVFGLQPVPELRLRGRAEALLHS